MRAQVIGGMPTEPRVLAHRPHRGSLPGRRQGHLRQRGLDAKTSRRRRRRKTVDGDANRDGVSIYADAGSPVVAVSDVQVTKIGVNERLGRFVQVQDAYGNTYTYGRLAKISQLYAAPKPQKVDPAEVKRLLAEAPKDKKPTRAASSTDRPAPKSTTVEADVNAAGRHRAAMPPRRSSRPRSSSACSPTRRARTPLPPAAPSRSSCARAASTARSPRPARSASGATRSSSRSSRRARRCPPAPCSAASAPRPPRRHPHVRFEIRPAGRGAPRIDPKPILDGWKLLESTAIYRAQGENPFVAADSAATVGQILLMGKDTLIQRVLNNPKITIYGCGRQDIQAGTIDRRVLATLEFLVANGFNPTITSLQCGHSYLTASGNVSEHSVGTAVDIAAINGTSITPSTQGKGSITERVIQSLLTLQGNMKPHQIISLMKFEGADNTLAMGDHDDHIHVGFEPQYGANSEASQELAAILNPSQWDRLIERLGEIDNPVVPLNPSKAALKVDDPTGTD